MVGWKDILRPIRDGLRDQLPSRKPRESDDEADKRRRQREADVLKGFSYFESFDEIESWSAHAVDPLQRANTPLLIRPQPQHEQSAKARVILVHDYAGNYHDYEACQGSSVTEESYSCEYMQFVDSFVYFSHKVSQTILISIRHQTKTALAKLVCVPPPTWTNSLHRNGVRCLGTFLVEPQSTDIGRILERKGLSGDEVGWEYPLATQLANMAESYGFDGWLINIEKTFPFTQWDRDRMVGFLSQLKSRLGHTNVIWYDALTTSNTLQYQNSLTTKNLPFAQAAGTLLTNYAWTPEKAAAAKDLVLSRSMDPKDIIFGIDVWAQNSQSKENGRRTYGGGGTGTGIAVAKLAELGFSAGVFAPAWPFEHFPALPAAVQRSMWCGDQLPEPLNCGCEPVTRHATTEYRKYFITRSAQSYPAGSNESFYTNFQRAYSGKGDPEAIAAHLGSASVLPRLTNNSRFVDERPEAIGVVNGTLLSNPPRVAIIFEGSPEGVSSRPFQTGVLNMFDLNMTGFLQATVTYRKNKTPEDLQISLDLIGSQQSIAILSEACSRVEVTKMLDCTDRHARLTGIHVRVTNKDSQLDVNPSLTVMEILEIRIVRQEIASSHCTIADIQLKDDDRLSWRLKYEHGNIGAAECSLPHSDVTGPFSHFQIYVNADLIGRAYALEYLLDTGMVARLNNEKESMMVVEGVGFHGIVLSSCTCRFQDVGKESSEGWQLVQRSEVLNGDMTAQKVATC